MYSTPGLETEKDLRTTRVDGEARKQHGISDLWAEITNKNVEVT